MTTAGQRRTGRVFATFFAGWAALAASLPVPALAESCSTSDLSQTRRCSDRRAAEIAQGPAWEACGGRCIIRQNGDDAILLDAQGKTAGILTDMVFLAGGGRTYCLTTLPFLTESAELFLFDTTDYIEGQPLPEPMQLPLAPLYDADPDEDPVLREAMLSSARISCDGARFFAPLQDGIGFSVEDITFGNAAPSAEQGGTVIIVSPSGRYALEVGTEGAEDYILRDFATGKAYPTGARLELDVPFFDVTESYLLVRRAPDPATENAASPAAMAVAVIDLATGETLGSAPYPPQGGMDFRVARGDAQDAVSLVPVSFTPEGDEAGDAPEE